MKLKLNFFYLMMDLYLLPIMNQSFIRNSIFEFPEEVSAYIISFFTTSELVLFGKTNIKTYKNTKTVILMRKVHTIFRERPVFDAIWWNLYEEKEHEKHCMALEGIVAKLGTMDDSIMSYNFITSLDTSSLKKFNRSIRWTAHFEADMAWLNILEPHTWTPDEQELVDLWHEEAEQRYYHYFNMY